MQINLSALDEMIDQIALKNWAVSEHIFSQEDCLKLAQECQNLESRGQLDKASIGHGANKAVHAEIRGDFIHWLDQHHFMEPLEVLRQTFNRSFFLGLKRVEAHYAFYPPGAGYDTHIDNPRGLNHRKMTFVLYLNSNWKKGDGGELSLFDPESAAQQIAQVEPRLGVFVLFRSDLFPHQVEKSFVNRMSLTGWFRDDAL